MTSIAAKARAAALQVEAKKHALRQQQDGCWILTMKVHQNDMPEEIMKAAMGQRYVCALVAVDDNEEPNSQRQQEPPAETAPAGSSPPARPAGVEKSRKIFSEMPYAQQAALRCSNPVYRVFLREMCAAEAPNAVFARTEEAAAIAVRQICEVESRRDIRPGTEAEKKWLELEAWFSAWQTKERAFA